jgi:hypothetical protein
MMTCETCSGSIPAYKTYTQKGYYDPPFRISGMSGAIEQTGKYMWPIEDLDSFPYVQWVGPVKIRSKPELKSEHIIGDIDQKRVYKVLDSARENFPDWKSMKVGDFETFYLLIGDAETDEQIGWAIPQESYKYADDGFVAMQFGVRVNGVAGLSADNRKKYEKLLADAKAAYEKLKASGGGGGGGKGGGGGGGGSGGGGGDKPPTTVSDTKKEADKKTSKGAGSGVLLALALGVGAYFMSKN